MRQPTQNECTQDDVTKLCDIEGWTFLLEFATPLTLHFPRGQGVGRCVSCQGTIELLCVTSHILNLKKRSKPYRETREHHTLGYSWILSL